MCLCSASFVAENFVILYKSVAREYKKNYKKLAMNCAKQCFAQWLKSVMDIILGAKWGHKLDHVYVV